MKWQALVQWHNEPGASLETVIISSDPTSIDDDSVMYTIDEDEINRGIIGDYLDFKIIKAREINYDKEKTESLSSTY